jgi:Ala-tRNA(Pro) deacylase
LQDDDTVQVRRISRFTLRQKTLWLRDYAQLCGSRRFTIDVWLRPAGHFKYGDADAQRRLGGWMSILDRWLQYLERNGIRYSHSVHRPALTAIETAAAECMPPHDLAKPVVYVGSTGFGIAVVPADELVDLLEVGRLLGISYIRLANEAELAELFPDCELGAMPPFGQPYEMPVLLDAEVAAQEFVAFAIGTHRDVVRMSGADYRKLVRPLIGSLSVSKSLLV